MTFRHRGLSFLPQQWGIHETGSSPNLVGAQCFSIQGYKRNKIYPDFVVQQGHKNKPVASVVVVESKGKHLKGNEDTNYKRKVGSYFERVGYKVPWQTLAEDFRDETFRFQVLDEGEYADRDWRDDLKKLLHSAVERGRLG